MSEPSRAADERGGAESTLAVSLRGIRKRFGYRDVLRGVDLEVERGSCVAIFGHNGAGKSTLLRIVATQWKASEGGGTVLGHDLGEASLAIRRRLGVVMHQSFLRDELTLEENCRLFASLYEVDDSARLTELYERFGLDHRRRDPVGTFSQGMTKRANLIRSLMHRPDLWILDEPFSGLDPEGQALLQDEIRAYNSAGGTAILVTHRLELGEELAERVVHLRDGDVVSSPDHGAGSEGRSEEALG